MTRQYSRSFAREGLGRSTSHPILRSTGGFALPLILAIIALGSILVASSFLMARLESQSGANTLTSIRAHEAAERGLNEIRAQWDPQRYDTMATGGRITLAANNFGRSGYSGTVARLSGPLFLVQVEGWYRPPGVNRTARKLLSRLVRLEQPHPTVQAALIVRDTLAWDTSSAVSGSDTIPPGWSAECAPDSSVAGARVAIGSVVTISPCGPPACLRGTPPFLADSAVVDSTLISFGPLTYAALAARATKLFTGVIPAPSPSVSGTPASCLLGDSLNWGEPLHTGPYTACSRYFPIIHAPGDLVLTGGRGQGILLVDGNLTLSGGVCFVGLVVVQGTFRYGGGGGSILGALVAREVRLDARLSGSAVGIYYSACVLRVGTRGSSLATPLSHRSWAQLY
jgi:hypothetical protein